MRLFTGIIIAIMICTSMGVTAQINISEPISVTNMDNTFGNKSPKIAMNGAGEIMVFWMRTGNEAFYINTLSNGIFSEPVQIPFGGLNPNLWGGSLGPNMAAYGDDVYVTFEVYGDAIYVVHSSDAGASWSDPVAAFVPPSGRKATIPIIAVDVNGQPYIAYVNTNNAEADAYYGMVLSTDFGATFFPEVDVSAQSAGDEVCECCNGHIDIAENGDIYVSFRNNDNNLRDNWLARSTDGGDTFSSAFDVDETDWTINACPSNGPHFSIVEGEVVIAFYSGVGSDGSGVYYSSFDTQNSIAGPTYNLPMTDENASGQNRPKTAGSGDTLAVVWQESVDGSIEIGMSMSMSGASGLSADPFRLTNNSYTQKYPDVLFSGSKFHVVYEDTQSGTVMYQKTSFGTVGIKDLENLVFQMGPNPCEGSLNIQLESSEPKEIIIFDAIGRPVHKEIITDIRLKLDLSGLKPGIYTVSLDGKRHQAQKLIKR